MSRFVWLIEADLAPARTRYLQSAADGDLWTQDDRRAARFESEAEARSYADARTNGAVKIAQYRTEWL